MRIFGKLNIFAGFLGIVAFVILIAISLSKNIISEVWYYLVALFIEAILAFVSGSIFFKEADRIDELERKVSYLESKSNLNARQNQPQDKETSFIIEQREKANYKRNIEKTISENQNYKYCPYCGFKNYKDEKTCGNCFKEI